MYLLRKCGNANMAADLVQESFFRCLEKYRHKEKSPAMLFTIGRNLFLDQVRRQKHFNHQEIEVFSRTLPQEDAYIVKEELHRIQNVMEKLSDDERDILALVVNADLSYSEVSAILDCSVANIKVKVHRARRKLRRMLEEENE